MWPSFYFPACPHFSVYISFFFSGNHLQCCVLNHSISELEGNAYNEINNFYLLLKTHLKM